MVDKNEVERDYLAEFIRELAEQEGVTFEEAQQLAIQIIRQSVKSLGQ